LECETTAIVFRLYAHPRNRAAGYSIKIEALAMIMVLTLMIYSKPEWLIRKRIRETGETVPNQLKKQNQKPTFKWIAFLFMGVAKVTVWINGEMHLKIANLNDNLVRIIRLSGKDCEKYYGLEG
jgi:transposase